MPGPVSDSYHPEFGTDANAEEVRDGMRRMYDRLTALMQVNGIDTEPKYILDVLRDSVGPARIMTTLTEAEIRVLRFALSTAEEAI